MVSRARYRRAIAALGGLFCFLPPGELRAEEEPSPRIELAHDLRLEPPIISGLLIAVVGWRLVRDGFEPSACRWCDGTAPGNVNAVDEWFRAGLRHADSKPANVTSYVLAFGAAPVSAAGLTFLAALADGREDDALVDVLAVTEAGLAAMLVTEVLEFSFLRTRPYVHAIADDGERARVIAETGAFHSFPAGHVVEVFGLAAASGVVASMRGYRYAPLVWTVGLLLGVATAYTRIAADRHYFTDALAGAAIGAAVGAAVPLVFHRPTTGSRPTLSVTPIREGHLFALGWSF